MDDCLFAGLSKKGCHTTTVCGLYRLIVVEKKAKEALSKKSDVSLLVNALINAKTDEEKDRITELLKLIK